MKMRPASRVVRVGDTKPERTDPNYTSNKVLRAIEDIKQLDEEWHEEFLKSFDAPERKEILAAIAKVKELEGRL